MSADPLPYEDEPSETMPGRMITAEEGRMIIDHRARQYFGMSGEEFRARYEAGELDSAIDSVRRIARLLPWGVESEGAEATPSEPAASDESSLDFPQPRQITAREGREIIDRHARELLGMSGEEFRRRYEAGELHPDSDDSIMHMVMILPLGDEIPGEDDEPANGQV